MLRHLSNHLSVSPMHGSVYYHVVNFNYLFIFFTALFKAEIQSEQNMVVG